MGNVGGMMAGHGNAHFIPSVVRIYSLRTHTYVEDLRFRTAVLAVRASSRLLVVSLAAQIYCFDAATLTNTFSVLTYPVPQSSVSPPLYAPVALGPRWLAYAANQPAPLHSSLTGRASPQHLSPSPGASPSTSPANGAGSALLAHMVKESGKHLAAGIVSLGDMSYRAASRISEHLTDGSFSPGGGNGGGPNSTGGGGGSSLSPRPGSNMGAEDCAGTVIVRDVVSQGRTIVAQFRAHTSPLLALSFDPTGTLLVTASVCGHSLNVYRLTPSSTGTGSASEPSTTYVHLYKLYRGMTQAVIQDVSFSSDSHWIAASSTRGTTHLFAICPFGGPVGPHTHGAIPGLVSDADSIALGFPITVHPSVPWWATQSALRSPQQHVAGAPQPVILTVVQRVKNHKGGWKTTLSASAAAASGRGNLIVGAVAATFHDGGGALQTQLDPHDDRDVGAGALREQLYVLAPTGDLSMYRLTQYVEGENGAASVVVPNGFMGGPPGVVFTSSGSSYPGNVIGMSPGTMTAGLYGLGGSVPSPGTVGMGIGAGTGADALKLHAHLSGRWLVDWEHGWHEGQLKVDSTGVTYYTGIDYVPGGTSAAAVVGAEGHGMEDLHRWYMSHAEVRTHQILEPLWANPRVQFQVLQPVKVPESGDGGNPEADGLGMAVEQIPTRRVVVRQKDLVPLRAKLEQFGIGNIQALQAPRDPVIETLNSDAQSLQDSLRGTGSYALAGSQAFGPMHPAAARVRRPSSGSSNSSADGHAGLPPGLHMGWNAQGNVDIAAVTPARLPPPWSAGNPSPHQQGSEVLMLERPSSSDDRLHNGSADDMSLSASHMNAPGPEGRLAPNIGPSADFNAILDDGRSEDQSSESNTPPSSFESSPSFFHSHHQGLLPSGVYSVGPSLGADSLVGPTLPAPLPPSAIIGSPPMAIPRPTSQGELRKAYGQSSRSGAQGSGLISPEDAMMGPSSGTLALIAPGHGPSRLGPREVGAPGEMLCNLPERTSSPDEEVGGVFDFETGPSGSQNSASQAVSHGLVVDARPVVSAPLGLLERGVGMRELHLGGGIKGWGDGLGSAHSLSDTENGWPHEARRACANDGQRSGLRVANFVGGGAVKTAGSGLLAEGGMMGHSDGLGKELPGDVGTPRSGWDGASPGVDADGQNVADGWDIGDGFFIGDDE